jgi:hypothetical protein
MNSNRINTLLAIIEDTQEVNYIPHHADTKFFAETVQGLSRDEYTKLLDTLPDNSQHILYNAVKTVTKGACFTKAQLCIDPFRKHCRSEYKTLWNELYLNPPAAKECCGNCGLLKKLQKEN